MTDEGILEEFYIDQEMQSREAEERKSLIPHCTECGYEGQPHRGTTFCPTCGAEMTMPGEPASDQTTYVDDDFELTVEEELGIKLSPDQT